MKLVSFRARADDSQAVRFGALVGGVVVDLARALRAAGLGAPADPAPALTWLDADGPWPEAARVVVEELTHDARARERLAQLSAVLALSSVRLLAPIARPGKILCIGLNYRDHAAETGSPVPEHPILFSKFSTAVVGPEDEVVIPRATTQVDYEGELGVVIGRRARRVPPARALEHVLAYVNVNDISARDLQFGDGQWQRGKSCDTFAPLGPWLTTRDEVPDPGRLAIQSRLNGEIVQQSNTSQMIFGVPELIAFLSEVITLEPGDVIATGTPAGVGFKRTPPLFLKAGDRIEVEVEGLGALVNRVVAEE